MKEINNKMDVIWKKQQKVVQEPSSKHLLQECGDGGAAWSCRICAGVRGLRRLGEAYIFEESEGRFDQLLYDCFGVTVSSVEWMICEQCVNQLLITQKFRALVHAAFERCSECSSHTSLIQTKQIMEKVKQPKKDPRPRFEGQSKKPPKLVTCKRNISINGRCMKTIAVCFSCGQKYPMLSDDRVKSFVCSRCKLKNETTTSATRVPKVNSDVNKGDARLRLRTRSLCKKLGAKTNDSTTDNRVQKYLCSQCPRRYMDARNLSEHMHSVHGSECKHDCPFCGKSLKTQDSLDKHLKTHAENHIECSVCSESFRSNKALQIHCQKYHPFLN